MAFSHAPVIGSPEFAHIEGYGIGFQSHILQIVPESQHLPFIQVIQQKLSSSGELPENR